MLDLALVVASLIASSGVVVLVFDLVVVSVDIVVLVPVLIVVSSVVSVGTVVSSFLAVSISASIAALVNVAVVVISLAIVDLVAVCCVVLMAEHNSADLSIVGLFIEPEEWEKIL